MPTDNILVDAIDKNTVELQGLDVTQQRMYSFFCKRIKILEAKIALLDERLAGRLDNGI